MAALKRHPATTTGGAPRTSDVASSAVTAGKRSRPNLERAILILEDFGSWVLTLKGFPDIVVIIFVAFVIN
jgi:hypothetical protein